MYITHHANVIAQDAGVVSSLVYPYYGQVISNKHSYGPIELDHGSRYYSRRRTRRPTALLIASYNSALLQQRQSLAAVGFNVTASHSLLDGYNHMLQLLALPMPVRPTVVLLDIQSIQPGFPELTGSLLAAVLAQHMQFREIHPAWLIGLSESSDSQRETEALVAGCHEVLPAPLYDEAIRRLQDLVLQSPSIPHLDAWPEQVRIIGVLQRMAVRVLEAVRDAYIESWSPDDLAQILGWLTRYPIARPKSGRGTAKALTLQTVYPERLVRSLGGPRAAHVRLRIIADQWQQRYPLHGQILHKFLDGCERREIVRYFVGQGLYEDTRIYTCIKELPERLSEQFRLDQVAASIA
jgi:CheY-like chemotaxis protein